MCFLTSGQLFGYTKYSLKLSLLSHIFTDKDQKMEADYQEVTVSGARTVFKYRVYEKKASVHDPVENGKWYI